MSSLALERAQDRQLPLQLLGQPLAQGRGDDELAVPAVDDDVIELGADRGVAVGGQRPRGRRPGHERGIGLVHERERDEDAGVVDGLVVPADLRGGERGAALRPPPADAVTAVEQALPVQLGERPPHALDVALVVGDVGGLGVDPEADLVGEPLPRLRVTEHGVDAPGDEGLDAVRLDLGLAVDVQLLLDLDLDGQPVRVPARLAGDVVAAHGLEAGEHVLDRAREHVAVVGHAVGGGRALVEHERAPGRAGGAGLGAQGLVEDAVLLPEGEDGRLVGGEVELAADRGEGSAALGIVALHGPVP